MSRRMFVIVVALVAAVVLSASTVALVRLSRESTRRRMAELRAQLLDLSPKVRLDAATRMLEEERLTPEEAQDARIVAAVALIEVGRFSNARNLLASAQMEESPRMQEILLLRAESYLVEAEKLVASTKVDVAGGDEGDLTADSLDRLLGEADSARRVLRAIKGNEALAATMEARALDSRASLQRQQLEAWSVELAKAQAVNVEESIQDVGVRVDELRRKVVELDARIEKLCRFAIELEPSNPAPYGVLLRVHLRAGQFTDARKVAALIVRQPTVERGLAGSVAQSILLMEEQFSAVPMPVDAQLAKALLTHVGLTGKDTLDFILAGGELSLVDGRPQEARELAERVLALYAPGHPRATYILCRAHTAAGKPQDAIKILQIYNERHPTAVGLLIQGAALLANDQVSQGREYLRQAIDSQPTLLPARLMLAESVADSGDVLAAGSDIAAAYALNPRHPRAIALEARLFIQSRDGLGLSQIIKSGNLRDEAPYAALTPGMVALVVLDDTTAALDLARQMREREPDNPIALTVEGWAVAPANLRREAASVIALAVLEQMDQYPLVHGEPRPGPDLVMASSAAAAATTAPPPAPLDEIPPTTTADAPAPPTTQPSVNLEPLQHANFLDWPEQSALDVLDLSLSHMARTARGRPELLELAAQLCLLLSETHRARACLAEIQQLQTEPSALSRAMLAHLDGQDEQMATLLAGLPASDLRNSLIRYWLALARSLRQGEASQATAQLKALLTRHPGSDVSLLLALREAVRRNDLDQARAFIAEAERVNRQMALLCRARLEFSLGRINAALSDSELMMRVGQEALDYRPQLADLRARCLLIIGQSEQASWMFDNLGLTLKERKPSAELAAIDTRVLSNRASAAIEAISAMVSNPQTPPRYVDLALSRLLSLAAPERIADSLENLQRSRPDDIVLMYYRSLTHAAMNDAPSARLLLRRIVEIEPAAARAWLLLAQVELMRNQPEAARQIYRNQIRVGGPLAELARTQLEAMAHLELAPPGGAAGGVQP